jgi:hypothetical protein
MSTIFDRIIKIFMAEHSIADKQRVVHREVADWLRISPQAWYNWRVVREAIPPKKILEISNRIGSTVEYLTGAHEGGDAQLLRDPDIGRYIDLLAEERKKPHQEQNQELIDLCIQVLRTKEGVDAPVKGGSPLKKKAG